MEINYKTWLKIQEADNKPLDLEAIKRFKQTINKFNNFKSVEINFNSLNYFYKKPRILTSVLEKYKEGLILRKCM